MPQVGDVLRISRPFRPVVSFSVRLVSFRSPRVSSGTAMLLILLVSLYPVIITVLIVLVVEFRDEEHRLAPPSPSL